MLDNRPTVVEVLATDAARGTLTGTDLRFGGTLTWFDLGLSQGVQPGCLAVLRALPLAPDSDEHFGSGTTLIWQPRYHDKLLRDLTGKSRSDRSRRGKPVPKRSFFVRAYLAYRRYGELVVRKDV